MTYERVDEAAPATETHKEGKEIRKRLLVTMPDHTITSSRISQVFKVTP